MGYRTLLGLSKGDERSPSIDGHSSVTGRSSAARYLRRQVVHPLRQAGLAGPLLFLLLQVVVFSAMAPQFLTSGNISLLLQQTVVVAMLAFGQTLIVLVRGVDLACGLVMVCGTVVMAQLAVHGTPVPIAILAGFAVTAAFGALEALCISVLGMNPFVVTLGLFYVCYALALLITNQQTVIGLPDSLTFLGARVDVMGAEVPIGPIAMLAVFAVLWYALTQTAWGRHVYATGNNPDAARLTGVRTKGTLASVYIVAGLLYGVAALLSIGRTQVADPADGYTLNLQCIAAVIIGGISLFGGRGSLIGALVGALIVGILRNGLTIVGLDSLYQQIAIGVLVIAAVGVDRLQRGRLV